MSEYKIEINNDKALIYTPYNADFVARVKLLGGKWQAEQKAWSVPSRAVAEVRGAMMAVYGRDDREPPETVDVILRFTKRYDSEYRSPITLLGRTVASSFGRDSGAKIGTGVLFLEGAPDSYGSVKNWYTAIPAGSVVKLLDVPKPLALSANLPSVIQMEIVGKSNQDAVSALKKEREALLARIAEIDRILSQGKDDA